MFDPTKGPGQITKKDCWISATVIGIYMALGEIPKIKVRDNVVILNNSYSDTEIILMSKPKSHLEASIRALRVYFSDHNLSNSKNQQDMTLQDLEHYGSPDTISELLLGKTFTKYCTHKYNLSRLFYNYNDIRNTLINKTTKDIMLCTFNFNPSHLYVLLRLKEDSSSNDYVEVIDVSNYDLVIREIKLEYVYILMMLQI